MAVSVLYLFHLVGLQCVVVALPGHTHFLFNLNYYNFDSYVIILLILDSLEFLQLDEICSQNLIRKLLKMVFSCNAPIFIYIYIYIIHAAVTLDYYSAGICCIRKRENDSLFVFLALRPKSTAMVIAGRSVHLTTLFSWAGLNKRLTSNLCIYFHL